MLELWLFLLSYVAHHGGNAVLLYKIQKKKSIDGICIDTQVMFLIGAVLRSQRRREQRGWRRQKRVHRQHPRRERRKLLLNWRRER